MRALSLALRGVILALLLASLLLPWVVEAAEVDIAGRWDTQAVVNSGPDSGVAFDGWIHFSRGTAVVAGTFQATIASVLTDGTINGTQTDAVFHGVFAATSPNPYQLTLDATISSDGKNLSGNWSDNEGRSGTYAGVRQTWETTSEILPAAGEGAPWNLLLASWALLAAALLSRGARKTLTAS